MNIELSESQLAAVVEALECYIDTMEGVVNYDSIKQARFLCEVLKEYL